MSDCPPEGFITGGMELCLPPTYAQQAMGARESRQPASIAISPAELAERERIMDERAAERLVE